MKAPRVTALFALLTLIGTVLASAQGSFSEAQVQDLLDRGDYETALSILDRRIARRPRDADALFLRSTAHIMSGNLPAGRRDLDDSLAVDPERREAWLNRAALDVAEQSYTHALEAFLEAERLDPRAPDNSLNIGATLLLAGDREKASERFRRYLEANAGDADAFLLVAANYAMAGLDEITLTLLERAVSLDERARLQIRADPAFADLDTVTRFQNLLTTDSFQPPQNAPIASRTFDIPYAGRDGRVLNATLTALQLAGDPISSGIEVTPTWALIWSDVRIKIAASDGNKTVVTVTAEPGAFSPSEWSTRSERLFRQIATQLHSRPSRPLSKPAGERSE